MGFGFISVLVQLIYTCSETLVAKLGSFDVCLV